MLALIHSPLVGPFSCKRLGECLSVRGLQVVVPELHDDPMDNLPFWQQHSWSAAEAIKTAVGQQPVVLIAHSGAGALLPAIRQYLALPVAGYVFMDAGIPLHGQSRLASFGAEAASFREFLAAGGRYPNWTIDDLKEIVPKAELAERLAADQRPRALPFWEEPIPVFAGWPDAPGAYLLFTDTYRREAERALAMGWPVRKLPAGHFHMLVAPEAVAQALNELIGGWLG
jgi:hypothetical protein